MLSKFLSLSLRQTVALAAASCSAAFALAAPPGAGAATERVTDGGFELGSPAWTYTNSQRCDSSSCGPLAPASGSFYSVIGPVLGASAGPDATVDVGNISQSVSIPAAPATVSLQLRRIDFGPATFDTEFDVFYDGTLVTSTDDSTAGSFVNLSAPISSGLDGNSHTLELSVTCFNAGVPTTVTCDRYDVDNVSVKSGPPAPNTVIDSGPSGATNDPTPTFAFHSNDPDATFACKIDTGAFSACGSPKTLTHLADGSHTFAVRAVGAGGTDPTPATRTFSVKTAHVSVSGSTLAVASATGAKDNLMISRPTASTIRVTDMPGGAYSGSGVTAGAHCSRTGDYTANCSAAGVKLIRVSSGDQNDKVTNSTAVASSLNGGASADVLAGGSGPDTLNGGTGADTMRGMNGSDSILGRDGTDDSVINCDGGTTPGVADRADLDPLPKDSPANGCETVTRH